MTDIAVTIRLDGLTGFKKELTAAGQQVQTFGKTISRLGDDVTSLGKKFTVGLTAPILAAGAGFLKLASDATESENLFKVAMGDMEQDAREFSEQLRSQLGLNAFEIRKQVGTFFQMTTAMGVSRDASFEMSTGLTQLTQDMASFFNLKPDEAFIKLTAGISGEVEPLKRLGIVVNETTTRQALFRAGLIETGEVLSEQQKIMGRYLAIVEQTGNAQGDLARTLDSPANMFRVLQSSVTDIAIEFGNSLMPILQDFLKNVVGPMVGALRTMVDRFKELQPETRKMVVVFAGLAAALGPALVAFGAMLSFIGPMVTGFGLLMSVIGGGKIAAVFTGLASAAGIAANSLIVIVSSVAAVAGAFVAGIAAGRLFMNFVTNLTGGQGGMAALKNAIVDTKSELQGMFSKVVESIKPGLDNTITTISDKMSSVVESSKNMFAGLNKDFKANDPFGNMNKSNEKFVNDMIKRMDDGKEKIISQFGEQSAASEAALKKQLADAKSLAREKADTIIFLSRRETLMTREQKLAQLQDSRDMFQKMGAAGEDAVEKIEREMKDLEIQIKERTFGHGARQAVFDFIDTARDFGAVAKDIIGGGLKNIRDALADFFLTGKISFKTFFDQLKLSAARFLADRVIVKLLSLGKDLLDNLMTSLSGSSLGSVLSGLKTFFTKLVGDSKAASTQAAANAAAAATAACAAAKQASDCSCGPGGIAQSAFNAATGGGGGGLPRLPGGLGDLGNLAAGAGAGFLGNQLAGLAFGSGAGTNTGSAIGGAVGFAVGGPVGAGIGSFFGGGIGSLFNDKDYKYARADVRAPANKSASMINSLELDKGPLAEAQAMGRQVAANVNDILRSLGMTNEHRGVTVSIGFASGRPNSKLGSGYFAGRGGSFDGGSTFTGLGSAGEAVGLATEVMLGRMPKVRAALNAEGIPVRAFETGGDSVVTRPTLMLMGEHNKAEQVSVRPLGGRGPGGANTTVVFQGPAIFDGISEAAFMRKLADAMNTRTRRF